MMTLRAEALPRTGPREEGSFVLAGSRNVWFDAVRLHHPGGGTELLPASAIPAALRDRLCAPRPDLCGLGLDRPRIMGILNVTPDSFSDGGSLPTVTAAVARARMMAASADILDIGGESTRPGAVTVTVAEEIRRTAPVIRAIRDAGILTPISIDSRKAAVAEAALDAGADMVNDVAALGYDPDMAGVVAARAVPVCLMHNQGDPATMQGRAQYDDVLSEVLEALEARVQLALAAGIRRERIIIDPGIGFGKTLQHNVTLLRRLALYHDLGLPLLLGASRKRFIGTLSGTGVAAERVAASVAVALHGAAQGAHMLRVHDTEDTRQALSLQDAMIGTDDYDS